MNKWPGINLEASGWQMLLLQGLQLSFLVVAQGIRVQTLSIVKLSKKNE